MARRKSLITGLFDSIMKFFNGRDAKKVLLKLIGAVFALLTTALGGYMLLHPTREYLLVHLSGVNFALLGIFLLAIGIAFAGAVAKWKI